MPLGAWASRPRLVEKTYISPLRFFDYSLRRPQAGRLRSQWLPHPKKPRYKVTFPLRKVTFIFIDQSFALLTYDFQIFIVTLLPKTNIIKI